MSRKVATAPLRVSVGEDDLLLRQCGLPVLTDGGVVVAAEAASAADIGADPQRVQTMLRCLNDQRV